jgi:hypothetical protein
MKFHVLLQRQDGRIIPRWQMATRTALFGDLVITDDDDKLLRRRTRTARLRDPQTNKELTPRLQDAVVIYVNQSTMVINGYELTFDDRAQVQTWQLSNDERALHPLHWKERE